MRALFAAIVSVSACASAWGQGAIDSFEADQTWLTVYPDNLAMIVERRVVNVPAGTSTLRFLGVSDQIVPQSAILQSFEGLTIESNFDGDLITKGALLDRTIGQKLTIKRLNPETGAETTQTGKLISAANINGAVTGIVLETVAGIEALQCSGLPESVVFNNLPDGLNDKPVLSMQVAAETSGEREIFVSYLSRGIGWSADYRLDVGQTSQGEGPLSGWLTLTNDTAKSFKNTPTGIVAGDLNMTGDTKPDLKSQKTFTPGCWPQGTTSWGNRIKPSLYNYTGPSHSRMYMAWDGSMVSSPEFAPPQPVVAYSAGYDDEILVTATKRQAILEELGDYKLYRSPVPVNVEAMQTKQLAFLDINNAEYERVYKFDFALANSSNPAAPQPLSVEYEIDNSLDGNLAKPLPAGDMRVMTRRENGKTAFLGEASLRNLAVDLPVEVPISQSSGVLVSSDKKVKETEAGLNITLIAEVMNATKDVVTAEIEFWDDRLRYSHIENETQARKPDTIIPTYRFEVEPESRKRLSLDVPVTERAIYRHELTRYLADPNFSIYEVDATTKEFMLKGDIGALGWARNLASGGQIEPLKVRAEIVSRDSDVDENNITRTTFEETFTISNPTNRDQEFRFIYSHRNNFELVSSDIEPDHKSRLEWTISIPANGQKTLRVKTRGFHGI